MNIYISHTAVCSGWDIDEIFKGTKFLKAARTNAVKNKGPAESDVKMLDWDFRGWLKNPNKIEQDHLQNAKDYNFDVIMSMDLFDYNINECFKYTDELKKYCKRVLIPIHHFVLRLKIMNWPTLMQTGLQITYFLHLNIEIKLPIY